MKALQFISDRMDSLWWNGFWYGIGVAVIVGLAILAGVTIFYFNSKE